MFHLYLLSLLSKHYSWWHHRWCYFTHKRRNPKICIWTEREASQRTRDGGYDWLCKLGHFLKWCPSAHKPKSKECLFSNRRLLHFLIKCNCGFKWTVNFIWRRCEHSNALLSHPWKEAGQRGEAWPVGSHQPGLSSGLCPLNVSSSLTSATLHSPGLHVYFADLAALLA